MSLKLTYAPDVWRLLNGILCIYKPVETSQNVLRNSLKLNLCDELNQMRTRSPQKYVELVRLESGQEIVSKGSKIVATVPDGEHNIAVVERPSLADHTAVIGPRYMSSDFRTKIVNKIGFKFSGLTLIGINNGDRLAVKIIENRWLRVYHLSGKFGISTRTYFDDGPIIEKATFHKITRSMLERILATSQASHQRLMFQSAGVPLDSQRAFELASEGMIRPETHTVPLVYSLKVLDFDLPNFRLEVKVINETEDYLATIIHELGIKLHSAAACSKIHCIKYGPFELQHALLKKHLNLRNIITNLQDNNAILKDFRLTLRDPLVRSAGNSQENNDEHDKEGTPTPSPHSYIDTTYSR